MIYTINGQFSVAMLDNQRVTILKFFLFEFLIRLIRSSSYPGLIPFFDKEVNDFDVPEYVS